MTLSPEQRRLSEGNGSGTKYPDHLAYHFLRTSSLQRGTFAATLCPSINTLA